MRLGIFICTFLFSIDIVFSQNWNLVWSDEFNGTELDSNYWTHEIGTGSRPEWNKCTPVCSPNNLDEIINNNYETIIVNDFLMLDENFNEISIFNTSGKKVVELENIFESKIDISNLSKGVYFLKGRNKINNRTIKIFKI